MYSLSIYYEIIINMVIISYRNRLRGRLPFPPAIDVPVHQRHYEQADGGAYDHRPYHGYGEGLLKLRPHVVGKQQGHHGKDGGQAGHDDGPQPAPPGLVDGFQ